MAQVNVRHEFNEHAIRVMMISPVGGVARDMYRRGQNVRTAAMRYIDSDTGRLAASLHVEQVLRGNTIATRIGSNLDYALAHHEGHEEIVPLRGPFLIFQVRGRWIFTKRVRQVEGTKYLTRALPAARN